MRLRSLRLACLSVVLAAACGDSPNSPTLFGTDNGTPRNGTISGSLVEYGTGAPIANATVLLAGTPVFTNAQGEFSFTTAPSSGTAVISTSPPGFLRRAFSINLAPSRTGLRLDAVRDELPFSLDFYRQFARNSYEGNSLLPLRLWTMAPKFYFNLTAQGSGVRVADDTIARMIEIFGRSVKELSAGRFESTVFETGTIPREAEEGWVHVNFYHQLAAGLGSATVGGNQGVISLRYDPPNMVSNSFTNPYNCESVVIAVADHEITHTMGFWHTANVFIDTFSGQGCPGAGRPAHVLYHAALAYSRPPGNRDPDSDPEDVHRAGTGERQRPQTVTCFHGPW